MMIWIGCPLRLKGLLSGVGRRIYGFCRGKLACNYAFPGGFQEGDGRASAFAASASFLGPITSRDSLLRCSMTVSNSFFGPTKVTQGPKQSLSQQQSAEQY